MNKPELKYSNTFSLNELISINKIFEKFKDYSEAYNYLINNYTKIDKNKIILNNNQINLTLFSNNEIEKNTNDNDIINEDSIEMILYFLNKTHSKSKSFLNFTSTVYNLKST